MQALKKSIEFETTFCTYTASSIIGQGGAGRVFAALDDDGNEVAIKLLNSDSASKEKRKRFKNELAFLRKTTHANLVPVLDHGISTAPSASGPFYVMPRYKGSLRELLQAKLAPPELIRIFGQLLDGVEAAHLLGAVHRDIKPENVLYRQNGNAVTVAVADFGVARFLPASQHTLVETAASSRLANFLYSAPEQRLPGAQSGITADIFALGLILNEMFTGAVLQGSGFKRISSEHPEFSYLDGVVDAMTQQDPLSRPATVEEVKRRIRLYHEEFMLKQRLSALRSDVVFDSVIDDPLVTDPVRIIDADWNNNLLKLTLSKAVNPQWMWALHNMGNYSAVLGIGPETFQFRGNIATVGVDSSSAQQVIDHFKQWLPQATMVYRNKVIQDRESAARREKEELHRQRQRDEERLSVVSSLRI